MMFTVAFQTLVPMARWAPLFRAFSQQRELRLRWLRTETPPTRGSLLDGADAGLFVMPPHEDGLDGLTLDVSDMVVLLGTGHRLARERSVDVADVIDEPFLRGRALGGWRDSLWTLDDYRGGPPRSAPVESVSEAIDALAGAAAVATAPAWAVAGMPHPGIVAFPLADGPAVATYLLWRQGDARPPVRALVDLARTWTILARTRAVERC
jgi:hypothetical protein